MPYKNPLQTQTGLVSNLGPLLFLPPKAKWMKKPKALHEAIVGLVVQGNGSTHQGRLACAGEVWMASVEGQGSGSGNKHSILWQPPLLL